MNSELAHSHTKISGFNNKASKTSELTHHIFPNKRPGHL